MLTFGLLNFVGQSRQDMLWSCQMAAIRSWHIEPQHKLPMTPRLPAKLQVTIIFEGPFALFFLESIMSTPLRCQVDVMWLDNQKGLQVRIPLSQGPRISPW